MAGKTEKAGDQRLQVEPLIASSANLRFHFVLPFPDAGKEQSQVALDLNNKRATSTPIPLQLVLLYHQTGTMSISRIDSR
jgi:hypothetical protein